MKVGLIDVDGHNFQNLALMRISAYHKAQGDEVEWWKGDLFYYDKVYKSKIFSDTCSQDLDDPMNCGEVISGGTGYCISNRGGVRSLTNPRTLCFLTRLRVCSRITQFIPNTITP